MPDTAAQINRLLAELKELRASCLAMEKEFEPLIAQVRPQSRGSAQNLLDCLALRRHDLRDLQSRLAAMGLSSLGRSESSTLADVEAVISILETLSGRARSNLSRTTDLRPVRLKASHTASVATSKTGPATLAKNADDLLGPAPKNRAVRVMVTMPSEAADSYDLMRNLVEAGMNVMRVDCAHDSEKEWESMITHLRRANEETGKDCRVQMDLAGPELRTGPLHRGYHVARWRVGRDARGGVITPAHIALVSKQATPPAHTLPLPVPDNLLRKAALGDIVRLQDSRGKKRDLKVINRSDDVCLCTCKQSGYVLGRADWTLVHKDKKVADGRIGDLPFVEEPLRLCPRDLLVLTKGDNRAPAPHGDLPHISCTLPEVFTTAKPGQAIFLDDGKIEGRICDVFSDRLLIEILHTGGDEAKLGSGKGINLPDTDPGVAAVTEKDRRDLDFIVKHADIVGLSFIRSPEDVLDLEKELIARGNPKLGIVLKIETRPAFDRLPHIILAALRHHPVGIMVARGDLAIEAGFERLAEIQEEILSFSEAAHVPVVWATHGIESMATTGIPARAEITDAAMGVRAECVMLNEGEHIVDAVEFLDRVLHRMQAHQMKKRSMLRRLNVAQLVSAAR